MKEMVIKPKHYEIYLKSTNKTIMAEDFINKIIEPCRYGSISGYIFNILKYVMRHNFKNGKIDLQKTNRYLDMMKDYINTSEYIRLENTFVYRNYINTIDIEDVVDHISTNMEKEQITDVFYDILRFLEILHYHKDYKGINRILELNKLIIKMQDNIKSLY